MGRRCWLVAVLVVAAWLEMTGVAAAGRVPATRTEGMKSSGTRVDITVPYLITGSTAFMSGYVAPRIYSSPIVDDPGNPQARPVFNLIFYGGRQAFGDRSNGAAP